MHHNRAIVRTLFGALVVLFAIWSLVVSPVSAAPFSQDVEPTQGPSQTAQEVTPNNLSIGDDTCLECHGQPGQTMELENGEVLDIFVPPQEHAGSVHGEMGYACVQCHTTVCFSKAISFFKSAERPGVPAAQQIARMAENLSFLCRYRGKDILHLFDRSQYADVFHSWRLPERLRPCRLHCSRPSAYMNGSANSYSHRPHKSQAPSRYRTVRVYVNSLAGSDGL